jgi:gluconate 2-dehydrogenase gamma chain
MSSAPSSSAPTSPPLEISASRQFTSWLSEQGLSLAFSTYQSGKLFLIGTKPDGSGFERLGGKRAAAWRQRIEAVQKTYVAGVEEMDRRSRTRFGEPFVALSDEQQDAVLTELEQAAPESAEELDQAQATAAWAPVEPAMQQTSAEVDLAFLPLLALHTRQGFYADPVYGGNRDRVGWQLIGFEGPASLAETHAGRYTTRPFFAEEPIDWETRDGHGR